MVNSAVMAIGFGLLGYGIFTTIGVASSTAWILAGIIAMAIGEATEMMHKRK